MKFKNPTFRKSRKTFPMEVSCGNCKTPILVYEKGGKGNLIKLQMPRIIEAEVSLDTHQGHLFCINCDEELAKRGNFDGNITFWIVRGKVNAKRLQNYKM